MKSLVTAMALVAAAGAAHAQSVEFRIVERRGQTTYTPAGPVSPTNDNQFDYAIQARVVGGAAGLALGNFSFNIGTTNGEAETYGDLDYEAISNADGTYNTGATQYNANGTVGRGGLAAIYSYLAGINPNFNGVINTTNGTFTNNPAEQDMGLVTGSPTGGALLLLADTLGRGRPDTSTSSAATTATLDPTLANTYLGANGNFVDIYHFQYIVSNVSIDRTVNFALNSVTAQVFSSLQKSNGVWGPAAATNATATIVGGPAGVHIIVPAPASAALLGLGGLVAARRRRTA